jgi:hypothetical protein
MYRVIGKLTVRVMVFYLRTAYKRQIRIGAGLAAVGLGVAAYFASRNVPEG